MEGGLFAYLTVDQNSDPCSIYQQSFSKMCDIMNLQLISMLRACLPPSIFKETGQETSSLFSLADGQGSVTRTEVEVLQLVRRSSKCICQSKPFFFHYPGQRSRRLFCAYLSLNKIP